MTTGKRASLATEAENKTSENTIFYYTLRVLYCLVQELHLSSPRYSHISRIKIFILFFNRILDLLIFEELRSEWIQFFFLYTAIWPLMLTTYSAGTQLLNDKKKSNNLLNAKVLWNSEVVPEKKIGNARPTICIMKGSGTIFLLFYNRALITRK